MYKIDQGEICEHQNKQRRQGLSLRSLFFFFLIGDYRPLYWLFAFATVLYICIGPQKSISVGPYL